MLRPLEKLLISLGAALFVGLLVWGVKSLSDAESAALAAHARWRWENITKPALESCRARGGIANYDGWKGTVRCDR